MRRSVSVPYLVFMVVRTHVIGTPTWSVCPRGRKTHRECPTSSWPPTGTILLDTGCSRANCDRYWIERRRKMAQRTRSCLVGCSPPGARVLSKWVYSVQSNWGGMFWSSKRGSLFTSLLGCDQLTMLGHPGQILCSESVQNLTKFRNMVSISQSIVQTRSVKFNQKCRS